MLRGEEEEAGLRRKAVGRPVGRLVGKRWTGLFVRCFGVFELRMLCLLNLMRFGRILLNFVGFRVNLAWLNFELADFDEFCGFYCFSYYFHFFHYFHYFHFFHYFHYSHYSVEFLYFSEFAWSLSQAAALNMMLFWYWNHSPRQFPNPV